MRGPDDRSLLPGEEPDYRFTLANERTFLAYLRTSLAFCAAGVAVLHLVDVIPSSRLDTVFGVALLVLGGVLSATSFHRWRGNDRAIRAGRPLPGNPFHRLLAYGLTGGLVVALLGRLL